MPERNRLFLDDYIAACREGRRKVPQHILLACDLVERKLAREGVVYDESASQKAVELIEKYFSYSLFDWEKFVVACMHCYEPDGTLVFTEFLIMVGRGNGKNGFLAGLCWYVTTPNHGVRGYNVDIVANSEHQAKTSFTDVHEMIGRHASKMRRLYTRTLKEIRCVKTGSYIRFNTSNARTKDGLRSAFLVFDELHEYQNDAGIRVFSSGFGKRPRSRIFKITTQGYVREGVLDDDLEIAARVLEGDIPDSRLLPLLYHAECETDVLDEEMWEKANPSIRYLPNLLIQMREERRKLTYSQSVMLDFYTKRHNFPPQNLSVAVATRDNLKATNRPLPDLSGWACTVGIDYSSIRDWASVCLHFRRGDERYDISRSWVCIRNPDLFRIKAPWRDWEECVPVDAPEILPSLLAEYIAEMGRHYDIVRISLDHFRFALLAKSLAEIGFDCNNRKNITLLRPSDIMRVQPVIDSAFVNKRFIWGDTPSLRWAANNTKLEKSSRRTGVDTGNLYYAKIEPKSRKTDPFMALVAAMAIEDCLPEPLPDWPAGSLVII